MTDDKNRKGDWNKEPGKPYDLTEEASRSSGDDSAAAEARKQESDDENEETNLGFVSSPEGDSAGENRVSTSISDD
jgi:hypothetical protein